MTTELYNRTNVAQQMYLRAISAAFRNSTQLYEPSVWLASEPEIEDKMLRDSDILQATNQRCTMIAGRQWTLQAENEGDAQSAMAVEIGTKLLKKLRGFTQARHRLARAFLHGQRIAKIHGRTMPMALGDGKVRNWWFPVVLEDVHKNWFRTVPKLEKGEVSAHYQRWDLAKNDWLDVIEGSADDICTVRHTYLDEQGSLGFGRGLREALGWLWYTKANVWNDYMRAAARFGGGVSVTKVDGLRSAASGLPNEELMRAYIEARANMRSSHDIVIDKEDDIEIVSVSGEGWQMFQNLTEALKSSMVSLILSANLTTSADKGGSYAMADVQKDSTLELVEFDREALEETITHSLLRAIWRYNQWNLAELGLVEEMPRFNIKQEKRLDPLQRAQVAQIGHTIGLDLSKEDLYEQLGFRQPQDGEEVLDGAEAPTGMDAGGFGDAGGGGSGDSLGKKLDFLRVGPPKPAPQMPPGQEGDANDAGGEDRASA